MPGINDKLVVKFDPRLVEKIRSIVLVFKDKGIVRAVRPMRMTDTGNLIKLTLWLERPDTLEEGEIGRYIVSVHEFEESLLRIDESVEVETEMAEFHPV